MIPPVFSFAAFGRFAVVCLALAALGACDTVRDTFGGGKKAPDEFTVLTKAPLSMPPDFALRPPEPGAAPLHTYDPRQQALSALSGRDASANPPRGGAMSMGETALLAQAGASNPDPRIRQVVNEELSQFMESDKSIVDSIMFWRAPIPPGTVVDAPKEAQRLRDVQAAGDTPVTGATPSIRRKERALLEGLF